MKLEKVDHSMTARPEEFKEEFNQSMAQHGLQKDLNELQRFNYVLETRGNKGLETDRDRSPDLLKQQESTITLKTTKSDNQLEEETKKGSPKEGEKTLREMPY